MVLIKSRKQVKGMFQHHDLTEKAKHVTDAIAVAAGSTATISHWLTDIINPVLTALISIATLVWLWYRIKDLRQNMKNNNIPLDED